MKIIPIFFYHEKWAVIMRKFVYSPDGGREDGSPSWGRKLSVCRKSGDYETKGSDLLKKAVENGGDRLDAFGPVLFNFYIKNGFEPVSYTPFDEKYALEGWKKELDKPEPVIFYKHTGKKVTISYDEFMNKAKPYTGDDGYQNAKDARDYDMKR